MKQHSQPRLVKDERDAQIDTRSRSAALDFVIAATQVLTLICLVKGNPAWKGSLALCLSVRRPHCFTNMISIKKGYTSRSGLCLASLA